MLLMPGRAVVSYSSDRLEHSSYGAARLLFFHGCRVTVAQFITCHRHDVFPQIKYAYRTVLISG